VNGTAATTRITSSGPWARLDGVLIANDRADLLDSTLLAPISLTETLLQVGGGAIADGPWTGTQADGSTFSNNCSDWTSASAGFGGLGRYESIDSYWSYGASSSCNGMRRLYCFED
jgi:hypothetical protein